MHSPQDRQRLASSRASSADRPHSTSASIPRISAGMCARSWRGASLYQPSFTRSGFAGRQTFGLRRIFASQPGVNRLGGKASLGNGNGNEPEFDVIATRIEAIARGRAPIVNSDPVISAPQPVKISEIRLLPDGRYDRAGFDVEFGAHHRNWVVDDPKHQARPAPCGCTSFPSRPRLCG